MHNEWKSNFNVISAIVITNPIEEDPRDKIEGRVEVVRLYAESMEKLTTLEIREGCNFIFSPSAPLHPPDFGQRKDHNFPLFCILPLLTRVDTNVSKHLIYKNVW